MGMSSKEITKRMSWGEGKKLVEDYVKQLARNIAFRNELLMNGNFTIFFLFFYYPTPINSHWETWVGGAKEH